MKKWLTGALMVLAFSVYAEEEAAEERLTIGDHAHEFGPLDFIQGEPFTLEENRKRRVTIVEFWATWCAPCKDSAPHLSKLYDKYGKTGLVVLGITEETPEVAEKFLDEMGDEMNYPVAALGGETQKKFYKDFDLEKVPYAFIIDKNGRIVWYGHPLHPIVPNLISVLVADIPEEFWPLTEKLSHTKTEDKKEDKKE